MRKRIVLLSLVLIFCLILFVEFSYGVVYGRLSGRVVRKSTGEGLEGVTIFVSSRDKIFCDKKLVSDNKGYFRVEKLHPQRYFITISHYSLKDKPGQYLMPEKDPIYFQIKPGEEKFIKVEERLCGTAFGRVLIKDKNGINPIVDETVVLRAKIQRHSMKAVTNEQGKYMVGGFNGEYFIEVSIERGKAYHTKYLTKIKLEEGKRKELPDIVFDFTNKTGVEGYVYSESSGNPIEGAHINFGKEVEVFDNVTRGLEFCGISTDSNGYFYAHPLPVGIIKVFYSSVIAVEKDIPYEEREDYRKRKKIKINSGEIIYVEEKLKTEWERVKWERWKK